jgi:hypothetical protein
VRKFLPHCRFHKPYLFPRLFGGFQYSTTGRAAQRRTPEGQVMRTVHPHGIFRARDAPARSSCSGTSARYDLAVYRPPRTPSHGTRRCRMNLCIGCPGGLTKKRSSNCRRESEVLPDDDSVSFVGISARCDDGGELSEACSFILIWRLTPRNQKSTLSFRSRHPSASAEMAEASVSAGSPPTAGYAVMTQYSMPSCRRCSPAEGLCAVTYLRRRAGKGIMSGKEKLRRLPCRIQSLRYK